MQEAVNYKYGCSRNFFKEFSNLCNKQQIIQKLEKKKEWAWDEPDYPIDC